MADAPAAHEPEFHRFEPTSDTPNSVMPVLVYRNAFSTTMPIGEVRNILHTNRWLPDPIAETNKTPLFQSTTHELHAVVRGRCQLLVGGTQYGPPPGMMIYLSAGDMVVYPVCPSTFPIRPGPLANQNRPVSATASSTLRTSSSSLSAPRYVCSLCRKIIIDTDFPSRGATSATTSSPGLSLPRR